MSLRYPPLPKFNERILTRLVSVGVSFRRPISVEDEAKSRWWSDIGKGLITAVLCVGVVVVGWKWVRPKYPLGFIRAILKSLQVACSSLLGVVPHD